MLRHYHLQPPTKNPSYFPTMRRNHYLLCQRPPPQATTLALHHINDDISIRKRQTFHEPPSSIIFLANRRDNQSLAIIKSSFNLLYVVQHRHRIAKNPNRVFLHRKTNLFAPRSHCVTMEAPPRRKSSNHLSSSSSSFSHYDKHLTNHISIFVNLQYQTRPKTP